MDITKYRKKIDEVIEAGPFSDSWESLSSYRVPEWYRQAKFGIFIHWGVYSVPAFGEWYAREMYRKGTRQYEYHLKNYGPQDQFGYKDFIPEFRGEYFNADEWMELFQRAGARYVVPVAEHHDGFQMYRSDLSQWNAANMGLRRDVIGELHEAAQKHGLVFGVSNHRAEHSWFFNGGLEIPSDVTDPRYESFYGKPGPGGDDNRGLTHDILAFPPTEEFLEDWLLRACELVDRFQPRIVWFDWWIHNIAFKPYLRKFAAYYYNRAVEWGGDAAINYKYHAFAPGSAVLDVERGQLDSIRPYLWQTDTAIGLDSWGYMKENRYKKPEDLLCDLVDIVSKNGCMLLNIGPRPDGTITEQETRVLLEMGKWLSVNGEGIYGADCYEIFGEGPNRCRDGAFTDAEPTHYTSEDIRFTCRGGNLYAFILKAPSDGLIRIRSLKRPSRFFAGAGELALGEVSLLGEGKVVGVEKKEEGLVVRTEGIPDTPYPVCLKIALK